MVNKTTDVGTAADNLSKTHRNKVLDQATKDLIDKLLLERSLMPNMLLCLEA